jgi:hypothetical protein
LERIRLLRCSTVVDRVRTAVASVLIVVVAGCSLLLPGPRPEAVTCAEWLAMPTARQTELAVTMVQAEDLWDGVRKAQHHQPGVPGELLIREVVASVTKNCDVMGEPRQLVVDLTMQLYAGGRAYDGRP